MKIHRLKLKIEFCDAILDKEKSFEIRKNDRNFENGDLIQFSPCINECADSLVHHEVEKHTYKITYVLNGWGLKDGFVAFAIKEVSYADNGTISR